MGSWIAAWLAVGAGAVVAALPGEAWACSCGDESTTVVLPEPGSASIPANAKVWIQDETLALLWKKTGVEWRRQCESDAPSILDEDGVPIPAIITELNAVLVLSADGPLTMGHTYQIQGCGGYPFDPYGDEAPLDLGTFRVDRDADETKPGLPIVDIGASDYLEDANDSCGDFAYVEVTWSSDEPGLLLVDVGDSGSPDLDLEDLSGHVSGLVINEEFRIGRGLCELGAGWGEAAPGASTDVRFGMLDLAGNFSGWTDPVRIEIEERCGCSTGSPRAGLIVLVVLPLVRRRKRGCASHSQ